MTTYVLVHGAWHGAWCWDRVTAAIEAAGNKVITPDLPGSGKDNTPVEEVSLDAYVKKLSDVLDGLDEKAVLVSHSMSGMVVSQTAELHPEKVSALVYVSGFLPQDGQSLLSLEESNPKPSVPPSLIVSDDEVSATIDQEKIIDLFLHDCSEEDQEFALAHIKRQALAPLATPVHLTAEHFGSVPRYYIECLSDRAICIEMQRQMIAASPCEKVFSIDSSHSPFFSKRDELVEALLQIS
ncbi:MAG: alpha/beta hydrolase [Gammaproteobacteria bacterium]|nr:alpha/beta hydrolase [Gammaproteobacteria bacterium]MAY01363.1 alpha/beta hydrolase [Gammaproteobacteria bacterium]|tara:strand:- start:224 stop:940 length:717 start_codon:yes stop_codon:yes gene_type:complete